MVTAARPLALPLRRSRALRQGRVVHTAVPPRCPVNGSAGAAGRLYRVSAPLRRREAPGRPYPPAPSGQPLGLVIREGASAIACSAASFWSS